MSAVSPEMQEFQARNVAYAQQILRAFATPEERERIKARLELAPTPKDVVHAESSLRLYRFRPRQKRLHRTPVLIVPSLILRYYVMDLMRGHSLIEYLVDQGIDTYLVDWGVPGDEHGHLTFDDYVDTFLRRCVRKVSRLTGRPRVALLGQCLGGTIASVYAALHPEQIDRLVGLTTPIDFEGAGLLALWTHKDHFQVDKVLQGFRNVVPADFIHACFQYLDVKATVERYKRLYNNVLDENFMVSYAALDHWLNDKIPFPARVYRTLIQDLYQENRLVRGELVVSGRQVDLANITCPVLNIAAEFDHVFPEKSTRALDQQVSGPAEFVRIGTGHVTCVTLFPQRMETFQAIGGFLKRR